MTLEKRQSPSHWRRKRASLHIQRRKALVLFILLLAAAAIVLPLSAGAFAAAPPQQQSSDVDFTFAVTADQRGYTGSNYDTSDYYRGVLEALKTHGEGAFMISPGDIDPPSQSRWTITKVLGSDYMWFPVVGNHEMSTSSDMTYLRNYNYDQNGTGTEPDIVNTGPSGCPETTYSFDYGNAHFAVINEYCDESGDTSVTDGDVSDHLYNWLRADLQATSKEHIFVIGHEPAYPQHDEDTNNSRHTSSSLNKFPRHRDRFWSLLKSEGVVAYIVGHTHCYSAVKIDGVWQVDAGHARGKGDTSNPSTFIIFHVHNGEVTMTAYRDNHDNDYDYDDTIHNETLKSDGPTPTPTITPTTPPSGSIDVRIGGGEDDIEELASDGSINVSSSDLELGKGNGWSQSGDQLQKVGMRFQNVNVPQGATITSAYIEFETDETSSESTSVTFYGEAADNANAFASSANNLSSRTKTSASVAWNDIPAWNTVNEKHQSPDLSAIVQEIVSRPGWAPGNSMVLMIEGTGKRVAESYDGESSAAPLLHVVYDSNAATSTPTPVVTATFTPAPTATPTSAPTATPDPAIVTTAFQNGVAPTSSYAGMTDSTIEQGDVNANYGADTSLRVDGSDPGTSGNDVSSLMRWDISTIPAGSTVQSVTIEINVTNQSANQVYELYELLKSWNEAEVTWNNAANGSAWTSPGALGADDRGSDVLGSLGNSSTGVFSIPLNSQGVAIVQKWVDDPGSNHGLIFADSENNDGMDFDSSEVSAASSRPKLIVTYRESSATATPAPTSTPTATPAPTSTPTATPAPTSTPTATPAPTSTPTTSSPKLNVGTSVSTGGWRTVTLSDNYASMVVVASPNYDKNDAPMVVRIRNAAGNSFDFMVQNVNNNNAVSGVTVHYVAVEEGVYTQANDGVKMEAVKYTSSVTDENNSWAGESRSYANSYTTPVVIGQVMSANDLDFSVFWSRGTSRMDPPSSTVLRVGKMVGEDPDATRSNEIIGYIVIEAGSGAIGSHSYLAALGSDAIKGVGNTPPYAYSLSGLNSVTAAVVSQAGMDGINGGWAILYGANPVTANSLKLAVDEDQLHDAERKHITEQVAYIVFE